MRYTPGQHQAYLEAQRGREFGPSKPLAGLAFLISYQRRKEELYNQQRLSIPAVTISDKPNASRSRVNKTAKKKLSWSPKSASGMIIPIQYGPGFAGENVFACGKNGNNLVIGSIIALGEIEEITKVYVNDVDASGIAGVTVTEYTGTTAQTADATLAAVFGGYADTLVLSVNGTNIGVAYVVVEIAPGAIDSAPRITVKYKGLKNIEDTRIPNTAYYTNPVLCFRNWLKSTVYGPGLSIDDTAFEALADHCDTVPADDWQASHNYAVGNFCKPTGANANNRMYEVTTDAGSSGGTEPASWDDTLGNTTVDSGITWTCRDGRRHVCGMPMNTSADLAPWIEAWRTACGAITFYNENGVSGVPDTTRATDHTFTHNSGNFPESPGITWQHESLANTPTVVKVIYTDTSALPWRDGTDARVAKSGVDAGTTPLRESTIYARGIHRKSEAIRLATKRLNAYSLTNLRVSFPLFDEGLEVCAGDVVEITHPVGFSSKTLRVLSNPIQSAGRWLVDGYEYDAVVYSNYLVTEPTSPDFGLNVGASYPRVFTSTPTTPYKVGDIWTAGPAGDIKRCSTARTSGAYQAGDWELASDWDKTSENTAADAAAYTGASIATTKTDAKCTDATADKTSTHTANNTTYINGSVNQSGEGDIQIHDDMDFYSSSVLKGSIWASSLGLMASGFYELVPPSDSSGHVGAANYYYDQMYSERFYVKTAVQPETNGVGTIGTATYYFDNMYSEKLNISSGDVTMATSGDPFVIHVWDSGSSSFIPYDAYIT